MHSLAARSRTWFAIAVLVVTTLFFGLAACDDATSGGVPPVTGILIRAETLTTGRGCGTGPTQIYKYAVLVYGFTGGDATKRESYQTFAAANSFDCYVDGEFVSLDTNVGNSLYRLEVYAYNAQAYNAMASTIEGTITASNTDKSGRSDVFQRTNPTFTTECTSSQTDQVETLAQCDPLSAGLGAFVPQTDATSIVMATDSFHLPDGRTAVCVHGGTPDAGADAGDAGQDAGTDASDDAGDAGLDAEAGDADSGVDSGDLDSGAPDADAGESPAGPVTFGIVRVRARVGGTIVKDSVDLSCGTSYEADVPANPATYTIDVGLVDATGTPIGQTACTVTTQTGKKSVVACP